MDSSLIIRDYSKEYQKVRLFDKNDNLVAQLDQAQYLDVRCQVYLNNLTGYYIIFPDGNKGELTIDGDITYFQKGLWNTISNLARTLYNLKQNDCKNR